MRQLLIPVLLLLSGCSGGGWSVRYDLSDLRINGGPEPSK